MLASCGDDAAPLTLAPTADVATTIGATIAPTTSGVDSGTTADPESSSTTGSSTTGSSTGGAGLSWPPEPAVPDQLDGFDLAPISIGGEPLWVAVADTSELRSRGLMNVTDFGEIDGMLFVFESPIQGGFWMKDTPTPLDIAFFAADGALVDVLQMEPCLGDQTCPVYKPDGLYQFAVETLQGDLIDLAQSARLDVG